MIKNSTIKGILARVIIWTMGITTIGALISPFVYHLVYCFQTEKYLLLVAGAIVPPVGWFHGLGAFFGWW